MGAFINCCIAWQAGLVTSLFPVAMKSKFPVWISLNEAQHGLDAWALAAPFISADAEINCNLASEWSELCVCGWGWRVPLWRKAFPNQDLQLKQHLAFPNDLAKLICIALQSIQQGWLSTQIPPEKSALGSGSLQQGWGWVRRNS